MSWFRKRETPVPPAPPTWLPPHRKVVECSRCESTEWDLTYRSDGLWEMRCAGMHLFSAPSNSVMNLHLSVIHLNN